MRGVKCESPIYYITKMHELRKQLDEIEPMLKSAMEKLRIAEQQAELTQLSREMASADFWNDSEAAQRKAKRHASLEAKTAPWLSLHSEVEDLRELTQLNDDSLKPDLQKQVAAVVKRFEALKDVLKLSGEHDERDAIITLQAGAGGTDAQDWTSMLLRMYVRWAESAKMKVIMLQESSGDEAGIKSATIEIRGEYTYGKLKGEHGVHRLVRLSPFNSDNLRQTSFAMVEVMPKIDEPDAVTVEDDDLKVDVYRSGGKGGQSVNTTDSAVRITHLPTNIVVAIQNERSQLQNRETAMTILRSKLAHLQQQQHVEKLEELKGPNLSAEWGNQIRSYVLHPYKQVKDLRTRYESSDPDAVLDGALNPLIEAYLDYSLAENS